MDVAGAILAESLIAAASFDVDVAGVTAFFGVDVAAAAAFFGVDVAAAAAFFGVPPCDLAVEAGNFVAGGSLAATGFLLAGGIYNSIQMYAALERIMIGGSQQPLPGGIGARANPL